MYKLFFKEIMDQKNGKNSLGIDICFEELDNPIELFQKMVLRKRKKVKLMIPMPSLWLPQTNNNQPKRKDGSC